MPKVFIKTKVPLFKSGITKKNLFRTAEKAEQIARDSILQNKRNGTQWPNLPFTSSSIGDAPAGQLSSKTSGNGLASSIQSKVEFKPQSSSIILSVDGRKTGIRGKRVAQYAGVHEFGDRPFLLPALKKAFASYKVQPEDFTEGGRTKTKSFRF